MYVCHYVLLVPYFCQWLHYDNVWKVRTFLKANQLEFWKTTLKYMNLFSLTSKILLYGGFYCMKSEAFLYYVRIRKKEYCHR